MPFRPILAAFLLLSSFALQPAVAAPWHITFDSQYRGPVEIVADIERMGSTMDFAAPGLSLQFTCQATTCEATTSGGNTVTLTLTDDTLSGAVNEGALAGPVTGTRTDRAIDQPLRDYPALAEDVLQTLNDHVFDPARLDTEAFEGFEAAFRAEAASARNDLEFINAMRATWGAAQPFSHVRLVRSHQTAAELAAFFDDMRLGYEVARLEWQGDIAVLTVDSMMGVDTIEQIEAAYAEIAAHGARALIIDIRNNGGGAFAIKPLIEHVIDEPQDIGIFLSRRWTEHQPSDPTADQVAATTPWEGWSILSFWADTLERGVVRLRFTPDSNNFDGPVYLLTSGETASASEIAADALQASGLVTIVGEQTQGAVLSQTMFDLSDQYQLSLPIADYVSAASGRLEGVGVTPDVEVSADDALDVALGLARGQ